MANEIHVHSGGVVVQLRGLRTRGRGNLDIFVDIIWKLWGYFGFLWLGAWLGQRGFSDVLLYSGWVVGFVYLGSWCLRWFIRHRKRQRELFERWLD